MSETKQCGGCSRELEVKIRVEHNDLLPFYATDGSAGMDLRADLAGKVVLRPNESMIIQTGVSIELPIGYEAQVRPRSSLSKKRIIVAFGTIDSDYRGVIGINIHNASNDVFEIYPLDRIAQMVVSKYERIKWQEVKELEGTKRGAGGFGSTGMI